MKNLIEMILFTFHYELIITFNLIMYCINSLNLHFTMN